MDGILDSSVLIHLFRKDPRAIQWIKTVRDCRITSITWMELVRGTNNKKNQKDTLAVLEGFLIICPNQKEQEWAMRQFLKFHLSRKIGMNDCLIASVAHMRKVPLYTDNLKHMAILLSNLAVKPY